MVKMFAFLPKRPDITEEKFHSHWRDPHGPMTKKIIPIKRYVQAHRIEEPETGLPQSSYLGIPEAWFESVEAGTSLGEDPNYLEGCHADEPNFIDMNGLAFLFTREHAITEGPKTEKDTPGVKLMHLIKRRSGSDKAAFAAGYEALAREQAGTIGARRDVLCVAEPDVYGAEDPVFDAVHELTFDSTADFLSSRAAGAESWGALADSDLLDGPGFGFLAEEYRVIWPEG